MIALSRVAELEQAIATLDRTIDRQCGLLCRLKAQGDGTAAAIEALDDLLNTQKKFIGRRARLLRARS